jgi:hypothetical protein
LSGLYFLPSKVEIKERKKWRATLFSLQRAGQTNGKIKRKKTKTKEKKIVLAKKKLFHDR